MNQNVTMNQHRSLHIPANNLQQNETQCLQEMLGNRSEALATAVAQILHGSHGRWTKQACGVLCFVKDYDQRLYSFRLYDLRSRKMIYEQSIGSSIRLEKTFDLFYTFDGTDCKVGINFADRDDAQTFFHHFHAKQEGRQASRKTQASTKASPAPIGSSISNVVQSPVLLKPPEIHKKNSVSKGSKFFTIGRSSKAPTRPEISSPVPGSMEHQIHIAATNSFVANDSHRQLFEQVLQSMNVSPAEAKFVRKMMKRNQIDYGKLIPDTNPSVSDGNLHRQQKPDGSPFMSANQHRIVANGSKRARGPHQDIAMPTIARVAPSKNLTQLPTTPISADKLNQLTATPIPSRPSPQPVNIPTAHHVKPLSAPPAAPPLPDSFASAPPAAPPLPPDFGSAPTLKKPLLESPDATTPTAEAPKKQPMPSAQSNKWLDEIATGIILKPTADRAEKPKPGSSAEPKLTMEDHIRAMIEQRRIALMGREGEEKESSDSSRSDFSD